MEKITKLTAEQDQKINEYRDRFFRMATSTKPGDKERAKEAALRLAEIEGFENCEVKFIKIPNRSIPMHGSQDNFIDNSLSNSIIDSLRVYSGDLLSSSLVTTLSDSIRYYLRESLEYHYNLWTYIQYSTWSLWVDTGWVAYYSFIIEELGIKHSDEPRKLFSLYRELSDNCSAIWIIPGTIIICEKPISVEIEDGKLISIEWGE